ncbi:hypothetical protein TNCV_4546981 [Trichonephila clavipes]|nr:hypothetical protein TNCV_4546981 [Trichonephila clavipes]
MTEFTEGSYPLSKLGDFSYRSRKVKVLLKKKAVGTAKPCFENNLVASQCLSRRSLGTYWRKTLVIDFHNIHLIPISYHSGSFAMREKCGNRLVSDLDYMVDALKLPNQALGVSGESL